MANRVVSEQLFFWGRGFWNWLDNRMIVRRLLLIGTMYLVWDSYAWCKSFAEHTTRDGLQIAAIIAAVTGPVTILLKFVVDNYTEGRK